MGVGAPPAQRTAPSILDPDVAAAAAAAAAAEAGGGGGLIALGSRAFDPVVAPMLAMFLISGVFSN